jgi:hypothetical protein
MALRILLKGEAALWRRAATAPGGPRWRRRCPRAGCWRASLRRSAAGAAALLAAAAAVQAEEMSWRDVESRIQYAYYTEDAGALRNLGSAIAADASHDTLHGYYAALLAWRLALLTKQSAAAAPGTSAAQLAQRCVSEADAALAAQADFADALALRAVCLEAGGAHAFAAYRAHKDLDRALQLAADNPRVLLADAMCDYELTPDRGGNKERALGKLRRAVAAFEAERSGAERLPGWGAAEAWLLLGADLLDHGDPVAARDALEHALLLAPEFAQARRLMAKITSG